MTPQERHEDVVRRYPGGLTPAQFRHETLASADEDGKLDPPDLADQWARKSLLIGMYMEGLIEQRGPGKRAYERSGPYYLTEAGRRAAGARGAFACPICRKATPHHHTEDEVQAARLMAMSESEVDAELRSLGIDPAEAERQGKAAVEGGAGDDPRCRTWRVRGEEMSYLTDEQIDAALHRQLPSQGESFDYRAFARECERMTHEAIAIEATKPRYWCNKCGYIGTVQDGHPRPGGAGECPYAAVPV